MVSTRQSSSGVGAGESSTCEPGTSRSLRTVREASHDSDEVEQFHILNLPQEILDKILSYMSYRNVSELRLVCRQFDQVCSGILNKTFHRLQTQMLQRFQSIKAKMPRRESARRNHPLACESDIVETLHMRLTLLQMTFGKHIERRHCCFFAGEILDEVYRILHHIKVTAKLTRPYKVTDELFDLSTMAMEYFKEKIEPTLPEIAYFGTEFLDFTTFGSPSNKSYLCLDSPTHSNTKGDESPSGTSHEVDDRLPEPLPPSNMVLRKRIRRIRQGMKRYNTQLLAVRRDLRSCKSKVTEQHKQILEYSSRLDEYDKKFEENSRKFSTLLQELNKCKTELQYWRSKSPANPLCCNCGKALPVSEDLMRDADVQALLSQGGLVEEPGEGEIDEPAPKLDFVPIASTSSEDWEVSKSVDLVNWPSGPNSEKEDDDVKSGTKRKVEEGSSSEASDVKKPRRIKGRKRVKI